MDHKILKRIATHIVLAAQAAALASSPASAYGLGARTNFSAQPAPRPAYGLGVNTNFNAQPTPRPAPSPVVQPALRPAPAPIVRPAARPTIPVIPPEFRPAVPKRKSEFERAIDRPIPPPPPPVPTPVQASPAGPNQMRIDGPSIPLNKNTIVTPYVMGTPPLPSEKAPPPALNEGGATITTTTH